MVRARPQARYLAPKRTFKRLKSRTGTLLTVQMAASRPNWGTRTKSLHAGMPLFAALMLQTNCRNTPLHQTSELVEVILGREGRGGEQQCQQAPCRAVTEERSPTWEKPQKEVPKSDAETKLCRATAVPRDAALGRRWAGLSQPVRLAIRWPSGLRRQVGSGRSPGRAPRH